MTVTATTGMHRTLLRPLLLLRMVLRPRTVVAVDMEPILATAKATETIPATEALVAMALLRLHHLHMTAMPNLCTRRSRSTTRLSRLRLIQMPAVVSWKNCRKYECHKYRRNGSLLNLPQAREELEEEREEYDED